MKRWIAFLPYLVVGIVHLGALVVGAEAISVPSKAMLMPALLLGLTLALLPRWRSEVALWAALGILLSWAGDVLLSTPGGLGFLIGLGAFMLAHLAYLVLFLRPLRERRMPRLALIYLLWWAALVALLAPNLGSLLVPVAIYGLVLGASASAALGSNRWVAVGGLLFLISDTVLAFKLFSPDFSLWQADAIIMFFYITGQGLIAAGAVLHVTTRVASAIRTAPSPGIRSL